MKRLLSLNNLSKYRLELMGIATLSIIILHWAGSVSSGIYEYPFLIILFSKIYMKIVSSDGVNWFAFLTGMGLWFSLNKNGHYIVRNVCSKWGFHIS